MSSPARFIYSPRVVTVGETARVSNEELRRALLNGDGESGFVLNGAPLRASAPTSFAVQMDAGEILIGVLCAVPSRSKQPVEIELLFGGREGSGEFTQMLLTEGNGSPRYVEFLPHEEARDSGFERLRVISVEWAEEMGLIGSNKRRDVFAFVRLSRLAVFRHGPRVGFNVVRFDRDLVEFSSWNLLAGHASPDAQSFGWLLSPGVAAPVFPAFPPQGPKKEFKLAVTNDVLMSVLDRPYTPERLKDEMRFLRNRGIGCLHWIEYGGQPSLQRCSIWKEGWLASEEACGGDLLGATAKAARDEGMELMADLKIFDFCFNANLSAERGEHTVEQLEGLHSPCAPEIAARPDLWLAANAAWRREIRLPVRTLRFCSRQPIPVLTREEIKLTVSDDNLAYSPYSGDFCVEVREVRRSHAVWSPAGPLPSAGEEACWVLELSGLELAHPFASVEVGKEGTKLVNLGYRFGEAVDASGGSHSFRMTNRRLQAPLNHGFEFQPSWLGWNNTDDPDLAERTYLLASLGLCFKTANQLPGVLEVSHPDSHKIWLQRMAGIFDAGVDGLCLRVLGHHYTAWSWLEFAFHPHVVATFEERHGRPPRPEEGDYQAIRKIRGEAFTDFLRKARTLTRQRNKKLSFLIEFGMELPESTGLRMQFTYETEKWIEEGLFDEFVVRGASPWWPWLNQWLLPRARKAGIGVHWMTRNIALGGSNPAARKEEVLAASAVAAWANGFDGFNFYESASLYGANSAMKTMAYPGGDALFEAVANSVEAGRCP